LSTRLIRGWSEKEAEPHTAIDDLESFQVVWVLLWAILQIISKKSKFSNRELAWITSLSSDSIPNLVADKDSIKGLLIKPSKLSNGFIPFKDLFKSWFEYVDQSCIMDNGPHLLWKKNGYQMYCRGWYEKYVNTGLLHLNEMPETWSEVFA
jgi:hypothetical protein